MELCESVLPGEYSLFLTVSELTRTHGFSHSSSAFGDVVHERFSEMDHFSEIISLQISAQWGLRPLSQGSAHLARQGINRQGGIRSKSVCPGKESAAMEQETLAVPHDTRSRPSKYQGNHHLGEWRLHPKVVQGILDKYGQAYVDLFALEVNGRPWTAEIVPSSAQRLPLSSRMEDFSSTSLEGGGISGSGLREV